MTDPTMARTGADNIAHLLKQTLPKDNAVVFGLPGVHNIALWPSFKQHAIRIIGSRHEQGCAYAADGYARSTGHLGVALCTTGPGAANALGACGEAWASKSPILVIATDIPTTQRQHGVYRGVLHECTDQAGMFAPVTKATFVVRCVDDIAPMTAAAIACALADSPGPTYLEIPTDLLRAVCPAAEIAGEPELADVPSPAPHPVDIAAFDTIVAAARRPIIWAGGGSKNASSELVALAERLGAPVITTFSSRGVIPASHPLSVNGPAHEQAVIELARSADLAIVIGSDLDHMNTMAWKFPLPDTRIAINVDSADANKNYPMTATMIAAANTGAALLARADRRQPWANLVAVHRQIADDLANDSHATEAGRFLEDTRLALDDDVTIFCDMAINGYWLSGYYGVERPRSLHYPMGWGTLGFALPAAIGAAAAGQTTVAFCGDGGALFAIGELATIAQENLPLTIVVIDDNAYGMLRYGRESERSDIGTELAAVDFVAVAGGFGIASQRIDGFGPDYVNALRDAAASGTPHLLHVLAELLPPRTTTPRWILK